MIHLFFSFGFKLLAFTVKIRNTPGISCILPTVATATNSRKDNLFLRFSIYLLPFLELASVKYLETQQFCENDFGQYFNLKKRKIDL